MVAPHQICPICAYGDDVESTFVDDVWVLRCTSPIHPPYEWTPKGQGSSPSARGGLGEELGVYDTLLGVLTGELVEYGIVEHLFAEADGAAYRHLVSRYGHRAIRPSRYTASSFLGGALGQLWREELVAGRWGPATGYWSYDGEVGCYAAPEADEDGPVRSWASYATEVLRVDPAGWPALGHTPGSP